MRDGRSFRTPPGRVIELIPRWIMAGYLTLFREIESAVDSRMPIDCLIVQGGVGALAAAAAWYFREEAPGRTRSWCQ